MDWEKKMNDVTLQLTIPARIYDRLQQVAEASQWPLEEVLHKTIQAGLPPSLAKVPAEFHGELLNLNGLDDQSLWRVVIDRLPIAHPLSQQQQQADFPSLRRAYAFALLKWRGHPVPMPSEFFIE